MKAIVKSIDTGSHVAFDKYRPEDETCFGLWLTVLVGPDDEEGGIYIGYWCVPQTG